MSVTVKKLNADTSFLLKFLPCLAPSDIKRKFPGSFTVLLDPWLSGHSSILHPKFQISHHVERTAIDSLQDLKGHEVPDLIIISQDKPDHCHRATLTSLPKDNGIKILATPAAAKKISSWKHFTSDCIYVIQPFSEKKPASLISVPLAAYSSSSAAGEVTIANLPTKRDMTGLHNAIGITYRPPGTLLPTRAGSYVNLSDLSVMSPPGTPRPQTSSAAGQRPSFLDPLGLHSLGLAGNSANPLTPPDSPTLSRASTRPSTRHDSMQPSPLYAHAHGQHKEKTLSVLYTPHGVDYSIIEPYAIAHLCPMSAVPLTLLLHSLNTETNPWIMGGVVAAGAPGGEVIARKLGAKWWISAHDEEKDNRGLATVWIKGKKYDAEEVQGWLEDRDELGSGPGTEVRKLDVGGEIRIER